MDIISCNESDFTVPGSNKQCPHLRFSFSRANVSSKHTSSFAIVTRVAAPSCSRIESIEAQYCPYLASRLKYCELHLCDFLLFRFVLDGASLSKYPKGWQGYRNIHGNSFSPLENSIYFVKWEAVRYAFDLGYDWTLLTDLDTIVTNPNVSFRAYTALADEEARSHGRPKSVLVVDRYVGSPNAGCAMVRNDPAGRAFLR
jgi:hypothetical protein